MATMIPAVYSEATCSNAERKVFNLLKKDPGTADWTVLHSLNLSVNDRRRYGEIDFVVLIPTAGIVCLEVKGGGVRCEGGVWFTTGNRGEAELKKSPFSQAVGNMSTLRDRMYEHFGGQRLPIGFIVVFPDCRCPPESPEFTRGEVIDCDDLGNPISRSILRFAREKLGYPGAVNAAASISVIKEIRKFLRPDFERGIARTAVIGDSEERIIVFTEEQLSRLEELEDNKRCLFEGAAGTGKTLLALHLAKKLAAEGKSVLFVCFNKILGRWLESQTEGIAGLRAGSLYRILRRLILLSEFKNQYLEAEERVRNPTDLYKELCEYGRLAIMEFDERFDVLIVDEIQDLASKDCLETFAEILHGGLENGEWAFFGDFTRQSIFNRPGGLELISAACRSFTRSKLLKNCRNTRQIAEAAVRLSGFTNFPYKKDLADGLDVEYHFWRNQDDQWQLIEEAINKYRNDGVSLQDIMILSPFRLENSGIRNHPKISGRNVTDVSDLDTFSIDGQQLKFCTVQAFKGMESPIVFVIDLENLKEDEQQSVVYVGMSRGRSALHVFASESVRSTVKKMLEAGKEDR